MKPGLAAEVLELAKHYGVSQRLADERERMRRVAAFDARVCMRPSRIPPFVSLIRTRGVTESDVRGHGQ